MYPSPKNTNPASYTFGSIMVSVSKGEYRYGMNGQEKADEISGRGNHLTAEYWEYDPRVVMRWNPDPIIKTHESPYAILAGNPVLFIDPNGADTIRFNSNSWSAASPPQQSGQDNTYANQALGGSSYGINISVADGPDVFFYNTTHIHTDANGNTTTTSSSQQFYPIQDHKNGITETPYFFGLLSYKDNDRLTLAKLAPTELLDYLINKNEGSDKMAFKGAKSLQSSYSLFEGLQTVSEFAYSFGSGAGLIRGMMAKSSFSSTMGILKNAASGSGNFGVGSATYTQAMTAGRSWVGNGYKVASDGKTLISADGLRQFRPPSYKQKLGITQANFEMRNVAKGAWQSNGHLNITK